MDTDIQTPVVGGAGDVRWLLQTTNRMLRCRGLDALLDLAYDAVRQGMGFDRVGLMVVDAKRGALVEHIGTDEQGHPFHPTDRVYPLESSDYRVSILRDPRMRADGPGYILERDALASLPQEAWDSLDGRPREVLRVALRTVDTVLGYISVDNLVTMRSIASSQIPALVAFTNALAIAIENVSLLEDRAHHIAHLDADLQKRVADLEWLRDIGRQVNAADTLDDVLDIVYDGIRDGLGYDRVGIVLLDRERQIFEECRGTDEHGAKTCPTDRVLSLEEDSAVWETPDLVALSNGADFYYTSDAVADMPPDQRYLLDGAPQENLVVPLRSGDRLTGLISVDNLVTSRPIHPEDAEPLMALALQVGSAMERVRLLDRERAERARLEVLLETARALNSSLDSERILRELASRLVAVLGATTAYFSEVDLDERALRPLAWHDDSRPPGATTGMRSVPLVENPTIERVVSTRLPLLAQLEDDSCPERESEFLKDHAMRAELLVPLVVQGNTIGVLEVYWEHGGPIADGSVELCIAIAEQAAIAMDNARLYAEAARRAEGDALTGLLNHRALLQHVDDAITGGARLRSS